MIQISSSLVERYEKYLLSIIYTQTIHTMH